MPAVCASTPLRLGFILGGLCIFGVGCGPKKTPNPGPLPDVVADTPVLPAPEARVYSTGSTSAADAMVEKVVEQGVMRWSESLAGAAGAMALSGDEGIGLLEARWYAVRAGYPYSVNLVMQGTESPGAWPQELVQRLAEVLTPADEVGIARARGPGMDRWVALVSRPTVVLNSFGREYVPGETLRITGAAAQWVLTAPDLTVTRGTLPLERVVEDEGEWWLEVRDRNGLSTVAVPLFVGIDTPMVALLASESNTSGPGRTKALAWQHLDDVRAEYDAAPLVRDEGLESLAGHPLAQRLAGTHDSVAGVERLRKAGFVGGPAAQLACEARTAAECVSQWLERAETRSVLLNPQFKIGGLQCQARAKDVTILLNLSSD